MKKLTLYYLLIPATLISSLFVKIHNISAQGQEKYGPMPIQPMYGVDPMSSLIWKIIRWLLVIIVPIAIIVLIVLGLVKLAKRKSKNKNKNILNVK